MRDIERLTDALAADFWKVIRLEGEEGGSQIYNPVDEASTVRMQVREGPRKFKIVKETSRDMISLKLAKSLIGRICKMQRKTR